MTSFYGQPTSHVFRVFPSSESGFLLYNELSSRSVMLRLALRGKYGSSCSHVKLDFIPTNMVGKITKLREMASAGAAEKNKAINDVVNGLLSKR